MEGRLFFRPKFRTKSRNFPALESLMKQKMWSGRGGVRADVNEKLKNENSKKNWGGGVVSGWM